VNGEPVREFSVLSEGAVLRFGCNVHDWVFCDAGPPGARAVAGDGRIVSMGPAGLLLPDADTYEASISFQDQGWLLERAGEARAVHDGEVLTLSDGTWQLELTTGDHSVSSPTTLLGQELTELGFRVSLNEEHVEMVVRIGSAKHVVGHRSHVYLLLLLARARIRDKAGDAVPVSEQGWMETRELADMLRTTSEQVNVWIWRARQQLKAIDPELAQRIVERRPTLGQLRIGYDALSEEPS
jgi:hypothetical protein